MYIAMSDVAPMRLDVRVQDPEDGVERKVDVRPFGITPTEGSRHHWSLSIDEAEELGRALLDAAREARSK